MSTSKVMRRPFWLITNHASGRMEVLTITVGGGNTALPVFSFAEEAELFLRSESLGSAGWRVRDTSTGELASLLYGPCAGAREVALDPLPGLAGGVVNRLVSVGRQQFLQILLGEQSREEPYWRHTNCSSGDVYERTKADRPLWMLR